MKLTWMHVSREDYGIEAVAIFDEDEYTTRTFRIVLDKNDAIDTCINKNHPVYIRLMELIKEFQEKENADDWL
jgi:hypothetical protein